MDFGACIFCNIHFVFMEANMYRVVRIVTGMCGWLWVEVGHNQGNSRIGHTLTAAAALPAPLGPSVGRCSAQLVGAGPSSTMAHWLKLIALPANSRMSWSLNP